MKTKMLAVLVTVACFVAFIPFEVRGQQKRPAKITWDLVQQLGMQHPITLKHKEWAELVYQRTKGQMEIVVRGPGELPYRGNESLSIVAKGYVQAAEATNVFVQAEAPLFAITELPFLSQDLDEALEIMKLAKRHYYEAFDKFGVIPVLFCIYGPTHTWTRTPINSMDEIKGMRMRGTTAQIGDVTNAYGGVSITLLAAETYQALKTGVADGFYGNTVTGFGMKWHEVTPYVLRNAIGHVSQEIVVSKKALAQLPDDIRKIVLEAAKETEEKLAATLRKADMGILEELIAKRSMKRIAYPTPEERAKNRAIAEPIWWAWANKVGPHAVEALKSLLADIDRLRAQPQRSKKREFPFFHTKPF